MMHMMSLDSSNFDVLAGFADAQNIAAAYVYEDVYEEDAIGGENYEKTIKSSAPKEALF